LDMFVAEYPRENGRWRKSNTDTKYDGLKIDSRLKRYRAISGAGSVRRVELFFLA